MRQDKLYCVKHSSYEEVVLLAHRLLIITVEYTKRLISTSSVDLGTHQLTWGLNDAPYFYGVPDNGTQHLYISSQTPYPFVYLSPKLREMTLIFVKHIDYYRDTLYWLYNNVVMQYNPHQSVCLDSRTHTIFC